MSNPFTATWVNDDNDLDIGQWEIFYFGQLLELSAEKRSNRLIEEVNEDSWKAENWVWLNELFRKYGIPADKTHLHWFFQAISANDWRCGSFYDLL
jgi:hypothetical protein